jgi:hypothetical protein
MLPTFDEIFARYWKNRRDVLDTIDQTAKELRAETADFLGPDDDPQYPEKRNSDRRFMLWFLPLSFIAIAMLSTAHECGHALAIILSGGIVDNIVTFPASLFIDGALSSGGYVFYHGYFTDYQIAIISSAGVFTSFGVGIIIFGLVFIKRHPPTMELFGLCVFITFSIEFIIYPLSDVLAYANIVRWITDSMGDWEVIYHLYPYVIYLMPILSIGWAVFVGIILIKRKYRDRFEY